MNRPWNEPRVLVCCAALTIALSGCKGADSVSAVNYIPEGAQFIGGVSVADAIAASGQQALVDAALAKDVDLKGIVGKAQACNLDPWKLDKVVFGGNVSEDFAVVVVGAGVGSSANLTCLFDKVAAGSGNDKLAFEGKRMTLDGKGMGYIINDSALVLSSHSWLDSVAKLVDGQGSSAVEGTLKPAYALAGSGKHLWFAMDASGDAGKELAKALSGTQGLKIAGGSMDFSAGGLAFALVAEYADGEKAKAAAQDANDGFAGIRAMAGALGVQPPVVADFSCAATDSSVRIAVNATSDHVKKWVGLVGAKGPSEMEPAVPAG